MSDTTITVRTVGDLIDICEQYADRIEASSACVDERVWNARDGWYIHAHPAIGFMEVQLWQGRDYGTAQTIYTFRNDPWYGVWELHSPKLRDLPIVERLPA